MTFWKKEAHKLWSDASFKLCILWSSARILFSTPFFDQVIGALIARSCNFQEQNIFMENVQKPGEVKYLQLFDGGAKYLQNSGQVACSSRRLSTPIIAPPKNFLSHFHCASMSPVWGFFGLNLVWIDVGCWTTPSPLRPSRLLRIDVRLLVAPSFTFASFSFRINRTTDVPHFSQVHFTLLPKNNRGWISPLMSFDGPSPSGPGVRCGRRVTRH